MFDSITRTLCDAVRVPMALVSLVDSERQWFKSSCGVDAKETPRSSSFCSHVIRLDGMMVVQDALADCRFAQNPLVLGTPYIRFYAGVPLLGSDGHAIGTLCALDTVPRTLTDGETRILYNLAATVQELIRLRQIAVAASALMQSTENFESEALSFELSSLLKRDPLTGLQGRTLLEGLIEKMVPAWRIAGTIANIAIVDIDNFSGINKALTYDNGDRVLIELAGRLRRAVARSNFIARVGADAFVVILCEDEGADDLSTQLERLWQSAQFTSDFSGQRIDVTSCVGFARFPADGESADVLINAASTAVRRGKPLGRGVLQPYYDTVQGNENDYLLEHDLKHAIESNELELHYQPKVSLTTGTIVGVEALVRWRHAVRGMVGPDAFIPLAEQTGLIVPLSIWVIDRACEELARWRKLGIDDVSMAVNLSSRLFVTPGLIETIASALRRHGLPGNLLDLEVTETGSMADPKLAAGLMKKLKSLGATISIDDFGTGYSSLSYLKDFPIDSIKIDRSFVAGMSESEGTLAIVQGMIATARRLGLQVIAEGVETVEQRNLLVREQCNVAQGYYYSRPVPGNSCLALLSNGQPLV